jgi:hypothetical protein
MASATGGSSRFDVNQGQLSVCGLQWLVNLQQRRKLMKALVDLFSTDYGLFSIGVIAFTIGMAIWFSRFFKRKMAESEQASRQG